MTERSIFDLCISALDLAVRDAISYPDINFVVENKSLIKEASTLAARTDVPIAEKNRGRVPYILNSAVTRYLARRVPNLDDQRKEFENLIRAIGEPGVPSDDGIIALDIISYFSGVAREYTAENASSWDKARTHPKLEAVRQLCELNVSKIVRRSVAQTLAAEQLASQN